MGQKLYVEVPDALKKEVSDKNKSYPGLLDIFDECVKKLKNKKIYKLPHTKQGNLYVKLEMDLPSYIPSESKSNFLIEINFIIVKTTIGYQIRMAKFMETQTKSTILFWNHKKS